MKTKLEMAHEYAMNYLNNPSCANATVSNIVSTAWTYADAMQAEADERKSTTVLPVLQQTFDKSYELVQLYGGLDAAKKYVDRTVFKLSYQIIELKQAIEDVESCL